jgi:uncharacterized protein (TIGR02300 family)
LAKPDLGTKRLCGNCGAKFYDLSKTPIVCPKCDTVFVVAPVSSRSRPEPARAPVAAAAPVVEPEVVVPETTDAEFVSLEDADAEATGAKTPGAEAAEGEEIEIDPALDADAFIEEQEEGDADVTDIIGDVDKEEEP